MFIAALFTTDKISKPPKCLSMEEWIKKMWDTYTHNGILFSHNKEGSLTIYDDMDEP